MKAEKSWKKPVGWDGEYDRSAGSVGVGKLSPSYGLSIIIPVFNESAHIKAFIEQLQSAVAQDDDLEMLVVDGGSSDGTAAMVRSVGVTCILGPRGRAQQMNFAATQARGRYLLFLHCDTLLPATFTVEFAQLCAAGSSWGFFALRLSGRARVFRLLERAISWRSALTGIGTGDQGIFVSRALWTQIGGYRDIALMEDVDLCKRLRAFGKPTVIKSPVQTSSRRWEQYGVIKTVVLMWGLRLGFYLGVSDKRLARWYGYSA